MNKLEYKRIISALEHKKAISTEMADKLREYSDNLDNQNVVFVPDNLMDGAAHVMSKVEGSKHTNDHEIMYIAEQEMAVFVGLRKYEICQMLIEASVSSINKRYLVNRLHFENNTIMSCPRCKTLLDTVPQRCPVCFQRLAI